MDAEEWLELRKKATAQEIARLSNEIAALAKMRESRRRELEAMQAEGHKE